MITYAVKKWFFDAKVVRAMLDGKTREALNRAGALVRRIAQHSMAYRAGLDLHSPPGTPPLAHPKTGAKLRRHLYYSYDPRARTVVVGPVPLGIAAGVPAVHEFGYSGMRVLRNRRRRRRKLGGVGEIRLVTKTKTVMADSPTGRDAVARQDTSTRAVYTRLWTPAQVRRSNELNEQLYGSWWTMKKVNYPARPYMRPALAAARPSLPRFWATSVAAPAVA